MKGFKKQGATVIALATEGDTTVTQLANHTIFIPEAPELLSPIWRLFRCNCWLIMSLPSAASMWIIRGIW